MFGIAESFSGGGTVVHVRTAGEAFDASLFPGGSPMLSGTGAGSSHIVATDITQGSAANQCKLIRVQRPNGSEHVVGTCDESGNIIVQPRASRDTSAQHTFNVCAYGGVADGKMIWDASIAAADDDLTTSTTTPFGPGDVGKHVRVYTAGGSVDLVTTIDSYSSSAHVVVHDVASSTASDVAAVVWGLDNHDAIQAAVDAVPLTGGTLYFPPADLAYVVASDITIPRHVSVHFAEGALLVLAGCILTFEGRVLAHEAQHIFSGIG